MIHTVTLNPTLDITYVLAELRTEANNVALEVIKTPGGKGINVSRALHNMGVSSLALGLIGGFTGVEVEHLLKQEGLELRMVSIANETRTNIYILNQQDSTELSITTLGPAITPPEHEELIGAIGEICRSPGYLVLSGSVPPRVEPQVYEELIASAKAEGMVTVLDSAGKPLAAGLRAGPDIIKPNRGELESLVGKELATVSETAAAGRVLVEGGVGMVVISLGHDGAVLVTEEAALHATGPVVTGHQTTGAGDSMVAGLLVAHSQGLSPVEMLRLAVGYGTAAVINPGPNLTQPDILEKVLPEIQVEPLF